jgi:uncharacterized iron-regulated protein
MDHKDLLKRRIEFYRETKHRVESILGKTSVSIERYRRHYLAEIKKTKAKKVTTDVFFKSLKKTNVLLFGDFHSEPQSIRSLLRVCRKLKSRQIALALECIDARYQNVLDKYLSGQISESDFIVQSKWNKNWNFSFQFVKPLLHWASQNQVPVYALNQSHSNLSLRDLKMAANIKKQFSLNTERMLIVQVGDYHLSKNHLPKCIRKVLPQKKIQIVFQSPDDLYFKLLKTNKSVSDFVSLGKNRWAVMAVLPWVKWQNYLLWLEGNQLQSKLSDDDVDMTDHIARCVLFLSDTVGIQTETSALSVYSSAEIEFRDEFKGLDVLVKSKIKKDMSDFKSFYVPELEKGYLESYSLNHISQIAAEYFLYQHRVYSKTISDTKKYFLALIWIEMLIYFFSKIMNPKRKTSTVFDMRSFLMSENFDDQGKDVLAVALEQKLKEMNSQADMSVHKRRTPHNSKSYAAAARLLGGIMGEKVFWAYLNKRLKFPEGKNFLFQDVYSKSFQIKYYDLIEVIDHWPNLTKSKFDQY